MKSVVGLVEYTVTGAFVWVLFAVFLAWISINAPGYSAMSPAQVGAALLAQIPVVPEAVLKSAKPVQEVISLILGGAVIVAVFLTGALLELLASIFFVSTEARWGKDLFLRSSGWLDKLVERDGALIAADYRDFMRARRRAEKPVEWEHRKYRRVAGFLVSYVLATAQPAQVDELLDRLKLWRMNQAICLSLVLLIVATGVWTLNSSTEAFIAFVVAVMLPLALLALTYLSMKVTFMRLAIALESALYLGFMQPRSAAEEPAPVRAPLAVAPGVPSATAGLREERQPQPVRSAA